MNGKINIFRSHDTDLYLLARGPAGERVYYNGEY